MKYKMIVDKIGYNLYGYELYEEQKFLFWNKWKFVYHESNKHPQIVLEEIVNNYKIYEKVKADKAKENAKFPIIIEGEL